MAKTASHPVFAGLDGFKDRSAVCQFAWSRTCAASLCFRDNHCRNSNGSCEPARQGGLLSNRAFLRFLELRAHHLPHFVDRLKRADHHLEIGDFSLIIKGYNIDAVDVDPIHLGLKF